MKKFVTVLFAATVLSFPCKATTLQDCLSEANTSFCLGIALGVMNAMDSMHRTCMGNITNGQVLAIMRKRASDVPELWNQEFGYVATGFVEGAWPCQTLKGK